MNKTIWMCWFQGEDKLKGLNKTCVEQWQKLNKDWKVILLTEKTIAEYVPEYFEINAKSKINHPVQKRANLLRILLLSKFGGVWVDASVYPMISLSDFYGKVVNDTELFTYRFMPREAGREIVNWFLIADKPQNYLIEQWKLAYIDFYLKTHEWKHYFQMHMILCELYDSDEKIKYIIDNMVQISASIPHSASPTPNCPSGSWKSRQDSFMYKRPKL